MKLNHVIAELKSMGDPEAAAGMARYGIKADRALGVSIPKLQGLAKKIGKNRKLAKIYGQALSMKPGSWRA
jgi:3-methyladenine DNA glycosylase AlkD